MRHAIGVFVFTLITLSLVGAESSREVRIDLGWITVVQQDRGWLVVDAPAVPPHYLYKGGPRRLIVGDLLLSIDSHALSAYGPLGVARMLGEVPTRRVPIELERKGKHFSVLAKGEGVLTPGTTYSQPRYQSAELQKRGQPAPAFTLPDTDGRDRKSAEFKGKWMLIVFWGTWCAGCMDEIPVLNTLATEHKDKLTVIGIDLNDTPEKLNKFLVEKQLSYLVLRGGAFDSPVARRYNFDSPPWNVLVSPYGDVVFVASATMNLKQEVEAAIDDTHRTNKTTKSTTALR